MIKNKLTSEKFETNWSCLYREEEQLFLSVSFINWEETETVSFLVENDEYLNDNYELIW